MGALADATLEAGGEVVGVIPQQLVDREIAHPGLTELHVVQTMHQRKALMAELSDAFVALPGGIGTLEELIEIFTWEQLGIHAKPLGVLNTAGYYDGLAAFLDHAVEQGFQQPPSSARSSLVAADAEDLLARPGDEAGGAAAPSTRSIRARSRTPTATGPVTSRASGGGCRT